MKWLLTQISKRHTHRPKFQAQEVIEAIIDRTKIQKVATDREMCLNEASQWKKQLIVGASELFTKDRKKRPGGKPSDFEE